MIDLFRAIETLVYPAALRYKIQAVLTFCPSDSELRDASALHGPFLPASVATSHVYPGRDICKASLSYYSLRQKQNKATVV